MNPLLHRPEPWTRGGTRFWRYLLLIIAAKVILEMVFFIGVAAQYGEESIFVDLALPSKEPGQTYWSTIEKFRNVPGWNESTGDPSDMYPLRISALYPNIFFMRAFGASETSLMLWSAITGIGAVLLVGLIGKMLADGPAGLFSAAVLSLIPGHIIYSARVDTDMPQLFFMCLGIVFLVPALKAVALRRQLAFAAASGLSLGLLYLAKLLPAFLVLPWALLIPFILAWLGDKETLLAPGGKLRQATSISAVLLGGFLLVFLAENYAYHVLSGFWWLNFKTMKGNAINIESWRCANFATFWVFKVWQPPGRWEDLFAHARMFWHSLSPVGSIGSIYTMPIHGWSGVAFLPAFFVLPFLRIGHRKLSLLVIIGFVLYYFYQEFFWLYPRIEGGMLNLTLVHKVHRFVFPCYIGISLCIGMVLGALAHFGRQRPQRWSRWIFQAAPVCLVFAFGAANYPGARYLQKYLRSSLADFRLICSELKAIAPDESSVYVAATSEPYFRLFQYPRHYVWKYFVDAPKDAVVDGWGVVGGSLGYGLSPDAFVLEYPEWLHPYYNGQAGPPPGWQLVRADPSAADPSTPMVRILKLPERGKMAAP